MLAPFRLVLLGVHPAKFGVGVPTTSTGQEGQENIPIIGLLNIGTQLSRLKKAFCFEALAHRRNHG